MADIVNVLRALPEFYSLGGVAADQIADIENALGLRFADDYREYLLAFGVASANGHEFTGICNSRRLNVVDVTNAERRFNPDVPGDWYVLEEANIDGIVIWQNGNGTVFMTQPGKKAIKLADSICAYLEHE